jgi:hypothetical protein
MVPHLIMTVSFIQYTSLPPAQICFSHEIPLQSWRASQILEKITRTSYPQCSIAPLYTPVKTLLARSRTSRDNGYAQHALKPQRRRRFRKFNNNFRENLTRHCTLDSSLWFFVTCIFADCINYVQVSSRTTASMPQHLNRYRVDALIWCRSRHMSLSIVSGPVRRQYAISKLMNQHESLFLLS